MANWQVVIEGRQGTDDMLNVLYYQSSGVEPPDFQDLADQIRFAINSHIAAFAGDFVTWVGITVREDLPGSVGFLVPFSLGVLAGNNATPSQVTQLAMLVRKQSSGLVRPTRGWAFQGGLVSEGTNTLGAWEAPLRAAVELLWNDLLTFTLPGPTTMQMVLKATNPTAPNTQAYTPVDTIATAGTPRTLDGRRIGLGS